jgi:hypothetical protein
MKNYEKTDYQFILKINDNIVCQRYFNIYGYNHKFRKSTLIKKTMDEICSPICGYGSGIIPNLLKKESENYLWNTFNPYYTEKNYTHILTNDIYDNESYFIFEILVKDEVIAQSSFSANCYPYEVRSSVNIRKVIPSILKKIAVNASKKDNEYKLVY